MSKIAFSLITSDNQKKYGAFHIKATETEVDLIEDIDPSLQQKTRDAVAPVFNRLRDELNKHIADMRDKIETAALANKSQKELKAALGKDIQTRVAKIDELLRKAVPLVIKKDEELAERLELALAKMTIKSMWNAGNLIWEGVEVGTAIGAAVASGGVSLVLSGAAFVNAVRKCIDLTKAVQGTIEAIEDMRSKEEEVRKEIKEKISEFKKIKDGAKVPSKLVDDFEKLVKLYPIRVTEVERTAGPLAQELDALLSATEGLKLSDKKAEKKLEAAISKLINKIIHINQYSESGHKLAAEARKCLAIAEENVATDWNRVLGAVGKLYESYGKLENYLEMESLSDLVKGECEDLLEEFLELEDIEQ